MLDVKLRLRALQMDPHLYYILDMRSMDNDLAKNATFQSSPG